MISREIDGLIATAMKSGEQERLNILRLIKNEFLKFKTDKTSNVLDENEEGKILIKMINQRKDSINQFTSAKRYDLADKEIGEIKILEEFAPKQLSESEIKELTFEKINLFVSQQEPDFKLSMKDMKTILAMIQEVSPTADGKLISKFVNEYIRSQK